MFHDLFMHYLFCDVWVLRHRLIYTFNQANISAHKNVLLEN
jgi:hypothetical protein